MSSVTMAADSTQADFIRQRVRRPVAKAAVRSGFRRGNQQGLPHPPPPRRDRSRSRRRSSSSRSPKPKRHNKGRQAKKGRRHLNNSSQSRSHDDTSDRDSDLDLTKDLLPISGYVRIKDEMVDHMFRSISNRKLRAMLPEILRQLSSDQLKKHCVEQLEVMSKKRICSILGGADPEAISSSGTEEEEDEDDDSSGRSTDGENDGPDVGNAYAENEVINSTSLTAVDGDLPLKDDGVIASHLENEDNDDNIGNGNPVINSSKNKDPSAVDDAGRDCHAEDRSDGVTDGKTEMEGGGEASAVAEKASNVELDGDEIFGITIKINEAGFGMEDPEVGGGYSQEESMKMNRRNMERSYRTKQLDDDEREADSDGDRRRDTTQKIGASGVKAHSKPKEKKMLSDSESIPASLPNLDSEPEETCCPYVFVDTKLSQELHRSTEADQRSSPSEKSSSETTFTTGTTESKEVDSGLIPSRAKSLSLDQSVCEDGATMTHASSKTREQKEETTHDVSEMETMAKPRPPQLSPVVEPVNDGEEMIIEVHGHEFSDDDGDRGFERERESSRRAGTEDSVKGIKVLTEIPRRKETGGSDVECADEEINLADSKRLGFENNRGLSLDEDSASVGKTLGRPKTPPPESEQQRGLKRRSAEIADERLQSKMQKFVGKGTLGECRSEDLKKCTASKNTGLADGKSAPTSRADLDSENRPNSVSSLEASHRSSESGASSRASVSLAATLKRDVSLVPGPVEQNTGGRSPSKLSRSSSMEDAPGRKVSKTVNPDARARVEISSSRVESSETVEGRATASKTAHRTAPSHPKPSSADRALSSDKEPATPVLSKTQLEILELEMRARAIKAMLKAQEELEKREEKVKMDEKRRLVISPSADQSSRSATESRSVVRSESKTIRIGASSRGEAPSGVKTTSGAESAQRVVRGDATTPRQSQDRRLVERRPGVALSEGPTLTRTVQSGQVSVTRPGFKSFRDVVATSKFPAPAYRLVKRPMGASAARGRGAAVSSCTGGSRIVRLTGGMRSDNRSVVPALKATAMRQNSGGPDRTAKMAVASGDRGDVRRVVASSLLSPRGSRALRVAGGSVRYGQRDRVRGPSPGRDQKRSNVAWNRRGGGNYRQQVSKAGRF